MGRFYVRPVINLFTSNPPKLTWHKLFHSYEPSGDILASFELIVLNDDDKKQEMAVKIQQEKLMTMNLLNSLNLNLNMHVEPPVEIPNKIKPKTRPYTLEARQEILEYYFN
jgi:hypothetical protein